MVLAGFYPQWHHPGDFGWSHQLSSNLKSKVCVSGFTIPQPFCIHHIKLASSPQTDNPSGLWAAIPCRCVFMDSVPEDLLFSLPPAPWLSHPHSWLYQNFTPAFLKPASLAPVTSSSTKSTWLMSPWPRASNTPPSQKVKSHYLFKRTNHHEPRKESRNLGILGLLWWSRG